MSHIITGCWITYLSILSFLLGSTQGLPTESQEVREMREVGHYTNNFLQIFRENDQETVSSLESGEKKGNLPTSAECIQCISGFYFLQYNIMKKKTDDEIFQILEKLCVTLDYGKPTFCKEYINQYGSTILTIMRKTKNTASEVCSFVQNLACGNGDVPGHRWHLEIPGGKPPRAPRRPPLPGTPKLKVLHVTDTHYDPLYVEGTKDVCDDWLCCRAESGKAMANESSAGKWGGWKCDIPERTLDNFLSHAKETHGKFDYIIWTGDLPPHSTWKQTKEESLFMIKSTTKKILKYFPDTPIFPAIGNHEACPPNLYPSPVLMKRKVNSWLYENLAKHWSKMLPESTYKTIKYGGFYAAPVRPELKIISLNTNFCYASNWWLILNSTDPADMLKWFVKELEDAEAQGVKVHVIGHIPPGSVDCLKVWGENFYNIISRFENTVTAQFYGHTHTDEIEIYYDQETKKRPVSVGYIGPSVTTFDFLNPGYRVYTIDGDHEGSFYDLFDYETYIMDLEKSNESGDPIWMKLYSAKDAYNLDSLLPNAWNNFYQRLKTDTELMNKYNRNYWKGHPNTENCDRECTRSHLFDIRSGVQYGPPVF